MSSEIAYDQEMLFSVGAVEEQLEKIYHDPLFTESKILRKFLSFIVQETIVGRSHCLKEYTIAMHVLDKPASFNPQENGIVRIHAGRLRRTLSKYYEGLGFNDPIIISIPKGKYVPVFTNRPTGISSNLSDEKNNGFTFTGFPGFTSLAVVPFICDQEDHNLRSFADGLCMQLGSTLTNTCHLSIIAYQALKNLVLAHPDYREMGTVLGFSHLITGGAQMINDTIRVNIQLVETATYRLVWSDVYEHEISQTSPFRIQDEICSLVVRRIKEWSANKDILNEITKSRAAL
ncbi:hypothetical protein [Pollutibacter soli]|uniref:hypothetical protein n=1 Tax=Pollutibacter soli TaxID=3034157 RepID=UPI0030136243